MNFWGPHKVIGHFGFVFFLALGLWSAVSPRNIQTIALKTCIRFYGFENPLIGWMKTEQYLLMLRILGVTFIFAAILIELVNLFGM